MAWKKILTVDDNASTVNNSFVTINADESVDVIRFNSLPPIDDTGYDSIADALAQNATAYVMAMDDVDGNKHVKLSFDDFAGGLALSFINYSIDNGYGDTTTYTGATSGLLGDFDGDGAVSTADLLDFLTNFGSNILSDNAIFLYSNTSINLSNCPPVSINVEDQWYDLQISNDTITGGSPSATVSSITDIITFSDGPDVSLSAFPLKKVKITNGYISVNTITTGYWFGFRAVVVAKNSSGGVVDTASKVIEFENFSTSQAGDLTFYIGSGGIVFSHVENGDTQIAFDNTTVSEIEVSFDFIDHWGTISSVNIDGIDVEMNIV